MTDREAYIPINSDDIERLLRMTPASLLRSAVLELRDQRDDRVKLQGEIERLTVELGHARATRPYRDMSPFDLPTDYRDKLDAGLTIARPFDPYGKTADIEALAQRLAKVEDGWAAANRDVGKLHARIDQACEIIGARIGGLEERLARLEQAPERFVLHENVKITDAPVEEIVAESEPLKPQRGDRVRLEGVNTSSGSKVSDGWYDVVGGDDVAFQIDTRQAPPLLPNASRWMPWVAHHHPGLKEVRPGAAKLPE